MVTSDTDLVAELLLAELEGDAEAEDDGRFEAALLAVLPSLEGSVLAGVDGR